MTRKMRNIIFAICPLLFMSVSFHARGCPVNCHTNGCYDDSGIVTRITNKLFALPEVKMKNIFVDSLTNHKKGISMRVMQKPDKLKKYYWIAVGYDSDLRFETYYNFYIWPDNMIIKYLHPYNGRALTLADWRKSRNVNSKTNEK